MIAVPAAITLKTVRSPAKLEMMNSDPTPHGYAWSLLLFLVPVAVIAFGFLPREEIKIPRKAFWWTIGILVPARFATDFFFASSCAASSSPRCSPDRVMVHWRR
jgi:hypothetical protein